MRLRLFSNAILVCSNASISSSHVNRRVVVGFVCREASIVTPHLPSFLKCADPVDGIFSRMLHLAQSSPDFVHLIALWFERFSLDSLAPASSLPFEFEARSRR